MGSWLLRHAVFRYESHFTKDHFDEVARSGNCGGVDTVIDGVRMVEIKSVSPLTKATASLSSRF